MPFKSDKLLLSMCDKFLGGNNSSWPGGSASRSEELQRASRLIAGFQRASFARASLALRPGTRVHRTVLAVEVASCQVYPSLPESTLVVIGPFLSVPKAPRGWLPAGLGYAKMSVGEGSTMLSKRHLRMRTHMLQQPDALMLCAWYIRGPHNFAGPFYFFPRVGC